MCYDDAAANRSSEKRRSWLCRPTKPIGQSGCTAASDTANASRMESQPSATQSIASPHTGTTPAISQRSHRHGLSTGADSPPKRVRMDDRQTNTDVTTEEITRRIYRYVDEEVAPNDAEGRSYYRYASLQPPITPDSLAELDMHRILNNPKLRHDVNFDRELHFRPNLDGSKGKQKLAKIDQYWRALEIEFGLYGVLLMKRAQPNDEPHWDRIMKAAMLRLPNVFTAVRDILKTLVPDQDQPAVTERLDVDHLVKEVQNGVCDLHDLSNWLARVLKNHCAPMRDGLVDEMQKLISEGATENCPEKLVSGLRSLMYILEAMKLDVANHQIRHMRPLLIDDTIPFQQRYNGQRLAVGKIDGGAARLWLEAELEARPSTPLDAFVSATARDLLTHSSSSLIPPSFYLDVDRLRVLRTELNSMIYLELCRAVLREHLPAKMSPQELERAFTQMQEAMAALVGTSCRYAERTENIAVELLRIATQFTPSSEDLDMSLLEPIETRIVQSFHPASRDYRAAKGRVAARIIPKLQRMVNQHARSSALSLQDILVPTSANPPSALSRFKASREPVRASSSDRDEEIVRRLTHILVLHWQVWAGLVYLTDNRDSSSDESEAESDSRSEIIHSAAPSPTMPAVEATFTPTHKFTSQKVVVLQQREPNSQGLSASFTMHAGSTSSLNLETPMDSHPTATSVPDSPDHEMSDVETVMTSASSSPASHSSQSSISTAAAIETSSKQTAQQQSIGDVSIEMDTTTQRIPQQQNANDGLRDATQRLHSMEE